MLCVPSLSQASAINNHYCYFEIRWLNADIGGSGTKIRPSVSDLQGLVFHPKCLDEMKMRDGKIHFKDTITPSMMCAINKATLVSIIFLFGLL